jgi:hypothetical protein
MTANPSPASLNPLGIIEAPDAYPITLALSGAVELELFTHIADGATTTREMARRECFRAWNPHPVRLFNRSRISHEDRSHRRIGGFLQ